MLTETLFAAILLAQAAQSGARVPRPATVFRPLATSIPARSVTPATITFTASNPDNTPAVGGSAGATVNWSTVGGSLARNWSLGVSAPANFSSCVTVPASAVTVQCASVTGGFNSTCGATTALSTTPVTIASGNENLGTQNYSVSLTFTLADSWKYIASSSCSLTVTYTITAN